MTLKVGMQHWVLEYYQIHSNDDPGLILTYFTSRSDLVPFVLVWGVYFRETIEACEVKVGTYSQINEHMTIYEPCHEKNLSSWFATRLDSNQPAQLQRWARGLKFWLYQAEVLYYPGSEQQRCCSDCADADAHPRRLICVFVVRIWHKQVFSWCGSYDNPRSRSYIDLCSRSLRFNIFMEAPVAEWLRPLIFIAHHLTAVGSSLAGVTRDKPGSACRWSSGFSRGSPVFVPPNDWLVSKWVK